MRGVYACGDAAKMPHSPIRAGSVIGIDRQEGPLGPRCDLLNESDCFKARSRARRSRGRPSIAWNLRSFFWFGSAGVLSLGGYGDVDIAVHWVSFTEIMAQQLKNADVQAPEIEAA